MKDHTIKKWLRHDFTPPELAELNGELARKTEELRQTESEKKSVASHYTGAINGLKKDTEELATKINAGHEDRNVNVRVKYDTTNWVKTLIRVDTQEVILEEIIPEDMRQADLIDDIEPEEAGPGIPPDATDDLQDVNDEKAAA